jgi:hypothetical protein
MVNGGRRPFGPELGMYRKSPIRSDLSINSSYQYISANPNSSITNIVTACERRDGTEVQRKMPATILVTVLPVHGRAHTSIIV